MITNATLTRTTAPDAARARRPFNALWMGVIIVHLLSAAGLAIFCELYRYVGKPEMAYYASFLNPDNAWRIGTFAWPFGILAAVHALTACRMVWASCVNGKLTFSTVIPCWSSRDRMKSRSMTVIPVLPVNNSRATSASTALKHATKQLVVSSSVTGAYFDHLHVFREAVEVFAQVVQAYWCSKLVVKSAINHPLVTVLVVNSWSTPFIHAVMGMHQMQSAKHQLLCRTLCLLVDAVLNTATAVMMPLLVLAPYWRDFNVGEYVFPIEVEYNDAFFAGLTSESQIIATGTVKGLLLRLVPHLSVLSSCFAIHEFVVTSATDIVHPMRPPSLAVKPHRHAKKPLWRKVVDSLFGAVGLVVLVIHIQTYVHQSTHPDDPLCSLPMAPWFATKFACKFACAVYTFDCSHFQRSSPLPGDLSFLEETALIKLNFAHCSALVVPRDIQRFPSMIGITIKHLTLVEWSRDAALTPEHHPSFTFVGFADTNLTEIPAGLLGTLPPLLQDIEFSHTNLTTIPDDLSHFWENVTTLYFEFSGVSTIPPSLMQLQLFDLSLVGNNVTDASVLSALSPSIGYVSLDYNPLSVLPASFDVGSDVLVFEFSSEHTLVRTVTTELLSSIQTLYLLDTPYCAEASDVKPGVECNRSFFGSDGKCYFP